MADWSTVKSLIVECMAYDGDASKSLSLTAVGTATDTRAQILLRNFSAEILGFFTRATPVTFHDSDWENVDLTDGSRCALSMSKVMVLALGSTQLGKVESVGLLQRATIQSTTATGIPAKGTPQQWAESDMGKISFDVPVDMSASPLAWASGWYRHPVLTYDTAAAAVAAGKSPLLGTCVLDETVIFGFAKYAAISLKENVTTVQAGMERLKRFDIQAYNAVAMKKAENLARYMRGLYNHPESSLGCGYGYGYR